ncbi:hypothetical protein [Roseibium sp.]|uniref:hypothetical protein n=1 Tax=Roseibium sp. TaxID=1936156 RepID=UPI003D12CEDD
MNDSISETSVQPSILKSIIGETVADTLSVHDYLQLYLSDRTIINTHNVYEISAGCVKNFEGLAISRIDTNDPKAFVFIFSDARRLTVRLDDEAFNGPEAMTLHGEGFPIVVVP